MTKLLSTIALATAAIALPLSALAAEISVSPLRINFQAGKGAASKFQNFKIFNMSKKQTAYVTLTTYAVPNPGEKSSQKTKTKVSLGDALKSGLTVSRNRVEIMPGQSKTVRLSNVLPSSPKKDKVFEVEVMPAVGKLVPVQHKTKDVEGGIRIVVGYDVGVVIRPEHATAVVTVTRKGDEATFRNSGNSNALISKLKQCRSKDHCVALKNEKRLYAGNVWTVKLKKDEPVQYVEDFVGKITRKSSQ
jgi:P pilus assembly chaperone PapD